MCLVVVAVGTIGWTLGTHLCVRMVIVALCAASGETFARKLALIIGADSAALLTRLTGTVRSEGIAGHAEGALAGIARAATASTTYTCCR